VKAEDKLRVNWSNSENCLMFHWPAGISTKTDAAFLRSVFTADFTEELRKRGYDLTTFRFSIEPAKEYNPKFVPSAQE